MQKPLFYKFLTIAALMLGLLIPINMISEVVHERQFYKESAMQDIARSWSGSQQVSAAVLAIPYKEATKREDDIYVDGKRRTVTKKVLLNKMLYVLPDRLQIDGLINTEERYRGIYSVPVYTAEVEIDGSFTLKNALGLKDKIENIAWGKPYLMLGVSDIRGIQRSVSLSVDGVKKEFLPGTGSTLLAQGIHAELGKMDFSKPQTISFNIQMALQGMEKLHFSPTAKHTKMKLASGWAHPSFTGNFLPTEREVNKDGFTAEWETSFFATNMQENLAKCSARQDCNAFLNNSMGLEFKEGVNVYQQTERSMKYALLFVGLTFVAFFLFEILKGLRIHMVQYGLVGFALALFYLLLVSLSEHLAFYMAYMVAAAACISLLGFYVSAVLKSLRRGIAFGTALSALYGSLYLLIRSEDHALLLGSGLIFSTLALVMISTRKIDWYKVEAGTREQLAATSPAAKKE